MEIGYRGGGKLGGSGELGNEPQCRRCMEGETEEVTKGTRFEDPSKELRSQLITQMGPKRLDLRLFFTTTGCRFRYVVAVLK